MNLKTFIIDYFIFIFIWVVFLMGVSFIGIEHHYIRHHVMPICAAEKYTEAMSIKPTQDGLKRYACSKKDKTPRNLVRSENDQLVWESEFK